MGRRAVSVMLAIAAIAALVSLAVSGASIDMTIGVSKGAM
jgi:hypothetical protein